MEKERAREEVRKLVEKFESYSKSKLDSMPEEDIKFQFIEPLFNFLGWKREEISKETRVLKGRADYILKIGNQDKLVVEAKKTSVSLSEEEGRQAVSYAYHKNIKFSVLTNFKYIRVYHALSNIKNIDKNLLKKDRAYFILEAKEFIEKFDLLWLLSKESFENEEINKLLKNVDKKLNKPIDESILSDLLQYREWLSKDLKSKRMQLENSHIDEIVQILIDRLIFMRSVEDRGLEAQDFLLKIIKDVEKGLTDMNLWAVLKSQFKRFDLTYNSKLFAEGVLEKEGFFDNNILAKVIRGLYYGTQHQQERYMFDEIPVDLLGSIYEQYLGVVLRGTEKRVKLDLESGKRKKMGIYYTPSYIVDYIVKNTIGEYCKEKSLDEVLNVKVVDPACGSGSFLIRAFQELINIVEEKLKKGEKSEKYKHTFQEWKDKLSLGEKATILTNCIYGVDLDEKAVELAQLNLLLKILEEETRETRKKILPNMKDNIKNGNSLISDSSYDKAFNWNAQFSDVFRDGGFDVVVGNPPYVNNRNLPPEQKKFFEKNYKTSYQQYDLYVLFYEKSLEIIKQEGYLGFIAPNKFTITKYGEPLRKLILLNELKSIVDVSQLNVFNDASTYPYVIIIRKNKPTNNIVNVVFPKTSNLIEAPNKKIEQISFDYKIGFNINQNSYEAEILSKISGENLIKIYRAKPTSKSINDKEDSFALTNREIERYNILNSQKKINSKKEWKLDLPAILMKKICFYPTATLIESENFIPVNTIYVIHALEKKIPLKYILAILNSKLIGWYSRLKYGNTAMRGGFIELRTFEIKEIPIKLPNKTQEQKIVGLVEQMLELQKKIHNGGVSGNEKTQLEQQIKNVDYEIDEEIYKLYGINEEEKKVIEEALG